MSRSRNGNKQWKYKYIGHIEVDFSADDIKSVIEYVDSRTWDLEDVICILTQQDIGVKFTYSKDTDSYRISLQPKGRSCYLCGYTLGYGHLELMRLVQIGTYIVDVMLEHEQIELPTSKAVNDW